MALMKKINQNPRSIAAGVDALNWTRSSDLVHERDGCKNTSVFFIFHPTGAIGRSASPFVASPPSIPSEGSILMIVSLGLPTAEPGLKTTVPPPVLPPAELPLFLVAVLVVVPVSLCVRATYLTTFTVYSAVKLRYAAVMTAVPVRRSFTVKPAAPSVVPTVASSFAWCNHLPRSTAVRLISFPSNEIL